MTYICDELQRGAGVPMSIWWHSTWSPPRREISLQQVSVSVQPILLEFDFFFYCVNIPITLHFCGVLVHTVWLLWGYTVQSRPQIGRAHHLCSCVKIKTNCTFHWMLGNPVQRTHLFNAWGWYLVPCLTDFCSSLQMNVVSLLHIVIYILCIPQPTNVAYVCR